MKFYLSCQSDALKGRAWEFGEGTHTVGRDPDCDVVLPERSVSRVHCRITVDAGGISVTDLQSSNGTWKNAEPMRTGEIAPGDTLRVGSVVLQISQGPYSPETAPPAPDSQSLCDTESLLLREELSLDDFASRPDTILDLASVCSLARELSKARSKGDLVKSLTKRLRRHLNPRAIFLLMPREDATFEEEELYKSRGKPPLQAEIRHRMAAAVFGPAEAPRAFVEFSAIDGESVAVVAAPTLLVEAISPVLIVELDAGAVSAPDRILDYLLAVGSTLGPFLHMVDRTEALKDENRRLTSGCVGKIAFVGENPRVVSLLREVRQVADTPLNVLITGETGVGKELVATILHDSSDRRSNNLVVVNCPAIPSELFASHIFGHRRGAFTGAHKDHVGYAQLADGGTLFLDEVADLAPENQAALLRFVETKTFVPVGGESPVTLDVRIVAATNARLPRLVAEGRFRSDLYHRLAAVHLFVPPLRERAEDIPALASLFLNHSLRYAKRPLQGITDEGLRLLMAQPWPGNARQLKSLIERAVAFAGSDWITERDLRDRLEMVSDLDDSADFTIHGSPTLDEMQRRYVAFVFGLCGGNGVKAGKILGLAKSTVYDKLRRYGILEAHRLDS
jgi:DNA-binding NtrC family response regulator